MDKIPLRITQIRPETPDTKSFYLSAQTGAMAYKPGQFLTVMLPRNKEVRRSYSLSSHPHLDDQLRISVKRIPNGEYSRWLFDEARVGDEIETIGASGFFTLPDDLTPTATLFFLAAGSGITPVLSLIREVLYFRSQSVTLIYSNRSEQTTIFYQELRALQQEFPARFKIEFLFSVSQNLLRARLGKILLAEFIAQHIKDKRNAWVYLCGPDDYMQMAMIVLITEGIPAANIRTEIFNTEKPKTIERPPDTKEHMVTIRYGRQQWTLPVKYPNTILQTAQQRGIELPYSCEAGRCGTCAVTCTKGKVWMSRNEVLLDQEIARGRILTCTGYPVGGDVELDLLPEGKAD